MLCVTAICILFASCKSDEIGSPVITSIRMCNASPNDTLMSVGNPKTDTIWSGGTGKYVAIIGQNLQNALSIKVNGVAAPFNNALLASTSAVVPIPDIVYSTIDTTKLYTLEYVTTTGSTTFSFKLGPAKPIISAISDVFANPGDSVYVYGTNLVLVQNFSYGGTPITSYKINLAGTALGFKMPSPAPTSGQVSLTTKTGSSNFKIEALPTITGVSNENANPGDSVYVYGTYLKSVQSFTFGGADISAYKSSNKGNSIGFVLPASPQSGIVSITTAFGTASTVYKVNDRNNTDGVLANMEWSDYFGWGWWGGATLTVNSAANSQGWITVRSDFDGVLGTNNSQFVSYKTTGTMKSGDGSSSDGKYNFPINGDITKGWKWIAESNLSDPVDNWAIKFEMSIAHPWNGGTLCFTSGFAGNYMARYEPWQITASGTAAFSTKGWQTVTIPLSSFRASDKTLGDGKGASVTSLTSLLGSTGSTSLNIYLHNFSTASITTDFYAAFDNVRVVRIK